VSNVAFMTRASAAGRRVASAMCAHALGYVAASSYGFVDAPVIFRKL
jgi:hypothetical protein